MKVILTQRLDNLGGAGETVTVAKGYARNYLIPRGLAVEATEANIRAWRSKVEKMQAQEEKEIQVARDQADKVDGRELTFPMKASESGRLFGSVTSNDIARELGVDRKLVQLTEPIKELGSRQVQLRFHAEVVAQVTVNVVAENDEQEEESADGLQEESEE